MLAVIPSAARGHESDASAPADHKRSAAVGDSRLKSAWTSLALTAASRLLRCARESEVERSVSSAELHVQLHVQRQLRVAGDTSITLRSGDGTGVTTPPYLSRVAVAIATHEKRQSITASTSRRRNKHGRCRAPQASFDVVPLIDGHEEASTVPRVVIAVRTTLEPSRERNRRRTCQHELADARIALARGTRGSDRHGGVLSMGQIPGASRTKICTFRHEYA